MDTYSVINQLSESIQKLAVILHSNDAVLIKKASICIDLLLDKLGTEIDSNKYQYLLKVRNG